MKKKTNRGNSDWQLVFPAKDRRQAGKVQTERKKQLCGPRDLLIK